jgi:hypothetical protein
MINPLGAHGKYTSETPAMFNKAHEVLTKELTIQNKGAYYTNR